MTRPGGTIVLTAALVACAGALQRPALLQAQETRATFRTAVALVPISAVVRDSHNRIVRDLNGMSQVEFLARVKESFVISQGASSSPETRGQWTMYLDGQWYGLSLRDTVEKPSGVVESLDVSILQARLLDPILGVKDVRTDKRIDFVGGIRGTAELEKLVNEVFIEDALFVHLLHQRPDRFVGKLADVVAKHDFVFGEGSQGRRRRGLQRGFRHGNTFRLRMADLELGEP